MTTVSMTTATNDAPAPPTNDALAPAALAPTALAPPALNIEKALEQYLEEFVCLFAGRPRQRSAAWLALKSTSIGGSELAGLLGMSPYSSVVKVVSEKAGLRRWTGGGVACWWGSMFESAIERYVELDCGTTLYGTDVNIPSPPSSGLRGCHANSPDGYGVVRLQWEGGEWALRTTARGAAPAEPGALTKTCVALFEFKCPYRRKPTGKIPRHYFPQVWSGLALSPIASYAVFVDAVFRKCSLLVLGDGRQYDTDYHSKDAPAPRYRKRPEAPWGRPVAWGFTAVYAPRPDAKIASTSTGTDSTSTESTEDVLDMLLGQKKSPSLVAWELHCEYFGAPYESPEKCRARGAAFRPDFVDLGDAAPAAFEKALGCIDDGSFVARHVGPCFPDGRGAPLRGGPQVDAALEAAQRAPPAKHLYLAAVIPWKMMEVDYVFVEPRGGFLGEIRPHVKGALDAAEKIRGSPDPQRAYQRFAVDYAKAHAKPTSDRDKALDKKMTDDFFDSIR